MRLSFSKMHGLGNDFIVIDATSRPIHLSATQLRLLADRHFGVGCDQILMVERPQTASADFRYRIFNADGGEVQQCGNGARCFARYVYERGLTKKTAIEVETAGGVIHPRLESNGDVTVDMGVPILEPAKIPFIATQRANSYELSVGDQIFDIGVISMGNPHAVLRVDDVATALVEPIGALIEHHPRFPERVNIGFMQIISNASINLRVFERGSGETMACGTGACAAVVVGRLQGVLQQQVTVNLRGGQLSITWDGEGHPVLMSGPATFVFEGTIDI